MKAVLVGAGIGGLTTALCLHRRGITVDVYEQADAVRELGVGRLNRLGGPERVIDLVETLAPDGFADIDDVIAPDQLRGIVADYAAAGTGATR